MPAVSSCNERWPLFQFWHHHLWPKLASFIPKFCRRKRSFQWYPDQSDRLTGTWDMHWKMLRNLSEKKNAAKFPATTLSYSMVKIACDKDAFSENLWTGSKPSRRSITAAGILEKEIKERQKKQLSKFHFCVCPRKNVLVGEEGMPPYCKCHLE